MLSPPNSRASNFIRYVCGSSSIEVIGVDTAVGRRVLVLGTVSGVCPRRQVLRMNLKISFSSSTAPTANRRRRCRTLLRGVDADDHFVPRAAHEHSATDFTWSSEASALSIDASDRRTSTRISVLLKMRSAARS